jgi:long-chain acyl-CoA synthetase
VDLARNLIGRINVGDSLTRTAAARPGQLAVVDGERRRDAGCDRQGARGP